MKIQSLKPQDFLVLTRMGKSLLLKNEPNAATLFHLNRLFNSFDHNVGDDLSDFFDSKLDGSTTLFAQLDDSGPILLRINNEQFLYNLSIVPIDAKDIHIELIDLTGSKGLQRQIQKQQETLELIDKAHPGALFQVKRGRNGLMSLDFASPRLPEIMQIPDYTVEQFLASMEAPDRQHIFDTFRSHHGSKEIVIEGKLEHPVLRYWLIRASILEENAESTIFFGVLENITDKTLALEQIRYTSNFLSSITTTVPIGISVTNIPERSYLYVNSELCRLTGYSEEEFLTGGLKLTRDHILLSEPETLFERLDSARD